MGLKKVNHSDELYAVLDATIEKLEDRAARAVANTLQKDWLSPDVIAGEIIGQSEKLKQELDRLRAAAKVIDDKAKERVDE
jgi:hypothetical protein